MQAEITENQNKLNEIINLWIKKDFINKQFSITVKDNIAYLSIKNKLNRLPFFLTKILRRLRSTG